MDNKCINCGAPLEGNTCKYCGSVYSKSFDSDISEKYSGKITFDGTTYNVYLSELNIEQIDTAGYRGSDGMLHRVAGKAKRTFTLIEY